LLFEVSRDPASSFRKLKSSIKLPSAILLPLANLNLRFAAFSLPALHTCSAAPLENSALTSRFTVTFASGSLVSTLMTFSAICMSLALAVAAFTSTAPWKDFIFGMPPAAGAGAVDVP